MLHLLCDFVLVTNLVFFETRVCVQLCTTHPFSRNCTLITRNTEKPLAFPRWNPLPGEADDSRDEHDTDYKFPSPIFISRRWTKGEHQKKPKIATLYFGSRLIIMKGINCRNKGGRCFFLFRLKALTVWWGGKRENPLQTIAFTSCRLPGFQSRILLKVTVERGYFKDYGSGRVVKSQRILDNVSIKKLIVRLWIQLLVGWDRVSEIQHIITLYRTVQENRTTHWFRVNTTQAQCPQKRIRNA